MDLGALIQLVSLKLGEQSAFYPSAEIVVQGINPAQRLLCLAFPALNYQRTAVTIIADQPFFDVRTLLDTNNNVIGNRFRSVRRVVLGTVTTDTPTVSSITGDIRPLHQTTVQRLAGQNDWLGQHREVQKYWMWGAYFLGLHPRPVVQETITIIYTAAPNIFDISVLTDVPTVPAAYHSTIAEIATGLLLCKEGDPQSSRGLARIQTALHLQQRPVA
jgi:hypothetical protein